MPNDLAKDTAAFSARTWTAYYVVALSIIALLSIVCHLVLSNEIRIGESSAGLINVSGRQRMLSQRISSMTAQYRLGMPYARQDLLDAINLFAQQQQILAAHIRSSEQADEETASLRSLYAGTPDSLDKQTATFLALARQVAATPPRDPAIAALSTQLFALARSPLLSRLDQVVSIRQKGAEKRIQRMQIIQSLILTMVLLTLAVEAQTIFRPMVRRIIESHRQLHLLATTDSLTGVANRRSFIQRASLEVERALRFKGSLSFLALDIDHFKKINDSFGHAAGDQALIAVANALSRSLRGVDILGRVGGEEFAVVLPETDAAGAAAAAERLRHSVQALDLQINSVRAPITVSIGVAQFSAGMSHLSDAMSRADAALYLAKQTGRNRVVCHASDVPTFAENPLAI